MAWTRLLSLHIVILLHSGLNIRRYVSSTHDGDHVAFDAQGHALLRVSVFLQHGTEQHTIRTSRIL
jgi:hypothetical protein